MPVQLLSSPLGGCGVLAPDPSEEVPGLPGLPPPGLQPLPALTYPSDGTRVGQGVWPGRRTIMESWTISPFLEKF